MIMFIAGTPQDEINARFSNSTLSKKYATLYNDIADAHIMKDTTKLESLATNYIADFNAFNKSPYTFKHLEPIKNQDTGEPLIEADIVNNKANGEPSTLSI